jgi:hypothetical protein
MYLSQVMLDGMDWIHLARNTDRWLAVVNTNEPLGFMKGGEFLDQQLASEEVNCSMECVAKQPDAVLLCSFSKICLVFILVITS